MILTSIIRNTVKLKDWILKCAMFVAGMMSLAALTACDSVIYDYEGDCDPYYKVRFKYVRNLKYADAFASEVNDVTLYVVDTETGKVVWQKNESGEALASGDYLMDVDVAPGTYTLVAWCGDGHRTHFTVGDSGTLEGLQCTLNQRVPHKEGYEDFEGSGVDTNLGDLYHAKLEAQVFPDTQGVHVYEMDLTKDTNDLHIVLQQMSGEPVEGSFTFTLVEDNGKLDWDNSLMPDEQLTYYAHTVRSGIAGVEVPDYKGDGEGNSRATITQVRTVVADLKVNRLMADRKAMVKIYNDADHSLVASIPLVDYALLVKGADAHLSDQDYLDYRDDYSMVLFLDPGYRWISTEIYINSWKIVNQDTEI